MTQAIPQDPPLLPNGRFSVSWQRFFTGLNTAGAGSVTSVSVVPANGISGTVGTATTTPAITLALGNITPTQVASSGPVTGTNLSGTNTGDETTATIKTKLGIVTLSGSNTGDQTISIGGDGAAAGSAGVLTLVVTKVNGVSFAGLATGILKNTTATGVPSIAVAGTDYVAPGGALGTPSSGTLTSCTGLPIATGVSGLAAGVATFLATPSSANMAAMITDETGTGSNVFATNPTLTNAVLAGNEYLQQGAPASIAAAATLTAAQMLGGIIQYTGIAANLTLPTGTLMDAAVVASLAVDRAFEIFFINTGSGSANIVAGVGFTIVGSVVIPLSTSAQFRCRKTAANTYVAYRIT